MRGISIAPFWVGLGCAALIAIPSLNAEAERGVPGVRGTDAEVVTQAGWIGIADRESEDLVVSLETRFAWHWHGIRPWAGVSVVDSGTWFAGAGLVYDINLSENLVITLGTGPFYYDDGGGDLGFDLEFYSFVEVTTRIGKASRAGLRFGHLSNAGLGRENPGTETLALVAVIPLAKNRRD